jgi:hypothetical protein
MMNRSAGCLLFLLILVSTRNNAQPGENLRGPGAAWQSLNQQDLDAWQSLFHDNYHAEIEEANLHESQGLFTTGGHRQLAATKKKPAGSGGGSGNGNSNGNAGAKVTNEIAAAASAKKVNSEEEMAAPKPQVAKPKGKLTAEQMVEVKKVTGGSAKTRFIFPRLYILGAQKGGSSSLYALMINHPLFCGGTHKEPMFFKEDEFFINGKDWYQGNYNDKKCKGKDGTFFVDGSTMMHRMPGVMERMDQFFTDEQKDDLRFIVLVREPVSRDFSWYQHFTRWYLEDHGPFTGLKTLQEHADTNKGNHFTNLYTHGEYAQQIKAFLGMFRRDQLLVINSEMCFKDSPSVMRIIAKFLNVPFVPEWDVPFPHDDHLGNLENQECVTAHVPNLDCSIRDELARWYEPKNRDLEQLMNATRDKAPPMEPAFKSFGGSYQKAQCVPSARVELDRLLKNSTKTSC